jgi:hypothetical protein
MTDWCYLNIAENISIKLDLMDLERVKSVRWRVERNRGRYVSIVSSKRVDGKRLHLNLAKFIIDPPPGKLALLKTRPTDGLEFDYRRSNLFVGTFREQNQARPKLMTKTSKYKGVSLCSKRKNWTAQIRVYCHI